jgi:predicted transcriptional regulator
MNANASVSMLELDMPKTEGKRSKERRGKLEIMVEILAICKGGALKTEIVYKANLNFKRVGTYIPFLEKRNLIESSGPVFRTTEKGIEFLDNYYKVKELFLS